MEFLLTLVIVLVLVVAVAWISTWLSKGVKSRLSSGKVIPDDSELRLLSIDQLITDYTVDELDELADIAISHLKEEDPQARALWEDFLRRVYEASDLKSGIYH